MMHIAPPTGARLPLPPPPHPRHQPPLLREVYGQLIRRLRTRQGRTLSDVAARAGVSVAYLSEIERGLKEPSSEVLEAVCTALGSSIAHLVGAAHRELVLGSSAAGPGLAAAGLTTDDLDAPDGAVGTGLLDLTRRHPGRSGVPGDSTVTTLAHFREVSLVAA